MPRSRKSRSRIALNDDAAVSPGWTSPIKQANRLKDEVYREMLLLEMHRPGSEMGLALALLRAIVQSESLSDHRGFRQWLKSICSVGLNLIEVSLEEGCKCTLDAGHPDSRPGSED